MLSWFKPRPSFSDVPSDQFAWLSSYREITDSLWPPYVAQVHLLPVLAVVRLLCHFRRLSAPPSYSPVAAKLVCVKSMHWANPKDALSAYLTYAPPQVPVVLSHARFVESFVAFAQDRERLLSLAVPLFVQGQMGVFASMPYPGDGTLTRLLVPVVESYPVDVHQDTAQGLVVEPPNTEITLIVQATDMPWLITCHPERTMHPWEDVLPAATALIIPQLVTKAAAMLPQGRRDEMFAALREELRTWRSRPPKAGERAEWSWLPQLV